MLEANLEAFFLGSALKHNQGFCWVHCEIRLENLLLLGYSGCVLSKYVKRGGEQRVDVRMFTKVGSRFGYTTH